ncbi:MAG: hypothetical protein Fur0032_10150 [Terrimicrobiaceae bacterium]
MTELGRVMKTLLITALCVSVASLSAIAGSCPGGGCGDKEKGKDKDKEAPKESVQSVVLE